MGWGFEGKALYFWWGGGVSGVVAGLGFIFQSNTVCVQYIFSETIGPTEAKFHVEPPWDRGRNFIQMVQVIIVNLRGAWALLRGAGAGILP